MHAYAGRLNASSLRCFIKLWYWPISAGNLEGRVVATWVECYLAQPITERLRLQFTTNANELSGPNDQTDGCTGVEYVLC